MPRPGSNALVSKIGMWGLLVLATLIAPQRADAWQAKRNVKHQIECLETQWRAAQLSGDIPTMDRMLADDYVGITMTGQVTTKVQQLERLRKHTLVLTRLDMQDIKVKLVGRVAIVTVKARVEGTSQAKPIDGEYRYTRIYHQLTSGTWKITNFEATRVGVPLGASRGASSGQAG